MGQFIAPAMHQRT